MVDVQYEQRVRGAAMDWLFSRDPSRSHTFTFEDLRTFTYEGLLLPLMDRQRGIRKPAQLSAAISIRTTYTPPGERPPYDDSVGGDGLPRYKYRGTDPNHPENVALRSAFENRLPLIWFIGAAPGQYVPIYPVWIVGDEPRALEFVIAPDRAQTLAAPGTAIDRDQRAYVERLTRQRVHQPLFRAKVLQAYDHQCAICRLKHDALLDAAHILPDGHPRGVPEVVNGLSLCKIHHAAYDQNLLGVSPDLVVAVRPDVRAETDGPMLLHGLQEMNGVRLAVPAARNARPDRDRLAERYAEFLRVS